MPVYTGCWIESWIIALPIVRSQPVRILNVKPWWQLRNSWRGFSTQPLGFPVLQCISGLTRSWDSFQGSGMR